MAQLPILYADEDEIATRRAAYRESLESLRAEFEGPSRRRPRLGGRSQPAVPARLSGPKRSRAAVALRRPRMPDHGQRRRPAPLRPPPRSGERIRLGIVSGYFWRHSNWKIPIKGWLGQIDRQKFQLFGYHTSSLEDAETRQAAALCDRFVQGPLPSMPGGKRS